jgi:hypothetical protein
MRAQPPWKLSPDEQDGYENGKAFSGTKGMLNLGKTCDCKMFSPGNKRVEERSGGFDQPAHHETFHAAVRLGAKANADIAINHIYTSLCHLVNIACRVGRVINFDPVA